MSDQPLNTYSRLSEPFAVSEHATVNKGGSDQTYVPWTEYVERMNAVLGVNNWSFRVIREGFTATECWVLGEIRAIVDGVEIVRQQYGCEPITKGRDAKPTTDLLKSSASDAIKKAASLLGVGLYLSVKEERVAIQQAMRAEVQAAAKAEAEARRSTQRPAPQEPTPIQKVRAAAELTGAPKDDGKRAEIVANCQKVMRLALAEGLDFEQRDPQKMTDQDIQDYGKALADMIRAARQAAS